MFVGIFPHDALAVFDQLVESIYRIMQIVHGGKISRLQHLVEVRGKTFAVVSFMQYLLTSLMKLCWKTFAVAS